MPSLRTVRGGTIPPCRASIFSSVQWDVGCFGKALTFWGRALTGRRTGVEPCLEIMPESGRGAVRGWEATGRRLWEESRREGSTEHLGQSCTVKDPLSRAGQGRVGLSVVLQIAPASRNQEGQGLQRVG